MTAGRKETEHVIEGLAVLRTLYFPAPYRILTDQVRIDIVQDEQLVRFVFGALSCSYGAAGSATYRPWTRPRS